MRLDGEAAPPLTPESLRRMTDVMTHRGPDDDGFVSLEGCSLGARRLSIVDVAHGHQPLSDERERIWAVQNGEIYNHGALRAELERQGHSLRTRCDTEVLPHLYEEHGPALAERLRGMFGLAVWDRVDRRGVLVRDRLGVKPLYYAVLDDMVVFGSELKAVIASGLVSDELDPEAIAAFLTVGYVPGPMTPLKQVRKLHPGERLVVENGSWRLERWWHFPTPEPEPLPMAEWVERIREMLDDSVRMRLMSDVPLGAMLSGGLDSSLVVSLMGRHSDQPVKTFSVGFEGADSELGDARRVAEWCGTEHHELEVALKPEQTQLEELVWHIDEPLTSLSSMGLLAVSSLAAEHVKVALSGQGADELFGGYPKHQVASLVKHWKLMPRPVRGAAAFTLRRRPGRVRRVAEALQAHDPAARLMTTHHLVHPELRTSLFSGALAEHQTAAESVVRSTLDDSGRATPLEAALYLDSRLGLVDEMLAYFDRASMARSLEVRVPFLDHEFVEMCARIPSSYKVSRLRGKHVLREAARGLVPDFVFDKPKRGFFYEWVSTWLAGDGGALIDRLLLAPDRAYEVVVDRAVVAEAVSRWRAGNPGYENTILSLIMLEIWLGTYLPRAFAAGREQLPRAPHPVCQDARIRDH